MKKNNQNKKKKRKINTDLAILLSHDTTPLSRFFVLSVGVATGLCVYGSLHEWGAVL